MSSRTENPLMSVAEVLEIVPSDDSWVNDGFVALVRSIKPPPANAQKKFWKCVLGDTTGGASINLTLFAAPKFREGDTIEVVGKGIKRKDYNGTPEVSIGKTTEFHVVTRASAGSPPPQSQASPSEPEPHQSPNEHGAGHTSSPVNQYIHGQTVGMAMKEALTLVTRDMKADQLLVAMGTPLFWQHVHMAASDIIRVSLVLEKGKLAAPVRERSGASAASPAPAPKPATPLTPPPSRPPKPAADAADFEEDVPF